MNTLTQLHRMGFMNRNPKRTFYSVYLSHKITKVKDCSTESVLLSTKTFIIHHFNDLVQLNFKAGSDPISESSFDVLFHI